MNNKKFLKSFAMAIVVVLTFSIIGVGFKAEIVKHNSLTPAWNGLCLSNEYDDYAFEFVDEDNVLPFYIDMVIENDSVKYINQKYTSYIEKLEENISTEATEKKAVDFNSENVIWVESYIPTVDLEDLVYHYVIRLKDNDEIEKERTTYDIFFWNDDSCFFTPITSNDIALPIQINNIYNFILFINDDIYCIGELSNFKELNNKVYISYDYLEINDHNKVNVDSVRGKATFSGYYKMGYIPVNFSIDDVKNKTNNYPTYEVVYASQGEDLEISTFRENSTIYRSAVSSPIWYSQMNANASGGSWNATNLSTLYYSTSTTLSSSTISTNKVFYSTTNPEFMSSGCALTCMAMLYRNRNGAVTRSFDYRGVSLSVKTTDPFTMSLVNTETTNVTGTTLIDDKNYYIVPRSPVLVSWMTCATYYGDTAYSFTFPTTYTANQKAAYIASKIDSYDGGVIVLFQSDTSSHYLLFTSYTLSNGEYVFTVCDPGRSNSYSQAVSTLDQVYKSYCQTLDNAVKVTFMD